MEFVQMSSLRDYNKALNVVDIGNPAILTRDGKPEFAVIKYQEFERQQAITELFEELNKGLVSLATEETYTLSDFKKWTSGE